MLGAELLPKLGADLVTALANLQGDHLARHPSFGPLVPAGPFTTPHEVDLPTQPRSYPTARAEICPLRSKEGASLASFSSSPARLAPSLVERSDGGCGFARVRSRGRARRVRAVRPDARVGATAAVSALPALFRLKR